MIDTKADELLEEIEERFGISSQEVLSLYSREFYSNPDEIKFLMEKIPDLTSEDIYNTVVAIKNPNPYSRFVGEINEVTVYDKDGNLKSEPKDWIKFNNKWYDKRELLK